MEIRKKRIAFFIEKLYEDLEFWYPYLRLKEEGCDTVVIGPTVGEYIGKNGLKASAEQSIVAVKPDEFNALIIPGGYSPDHMRRIPEMVDFVKTMHEQNKLIAAICHGPWMLASAGILNGIKLTSFYSIKDDLVNAGAQWIDKEVVCDKHIITSRNPKDLPFFCKAIIDNLKKSQNE